MRTKASGAIERAEEATSDLHVFIDSLKRRCYKKRIHFRGGKFFGCSSIGHQKASAELEETGKKHRVEVEAKNAD
jgi:hypothetical protein